MDPLARFSRIPEPSPVPVNARDIGYSTVKLWTEFQMLNRIIYRSKNQHRSSFSFHRLQEVKRTGERIGRLELWLKANFAENFEFIGYLNTLRLYILKGREAAVKAFYYYMHYLEQALFPQLALIAVGVVASISKELGQWLKYIHLLYNSIAGKLLTNASMEAQFKLHNLPLKLDPYNPESVKITTNVKITPNVKNTSNIKNTTSPARPASPSNPSNSKMLPQSSTISKSVSKPSKPSKTKADGDEIDAIFDLF